MVPIGAVLAVLAAAVILRWRLKLLTTFAVYLCRCFHTHTFLATRKGLFGIGAESGRYSEDGSQACRNEVPDCRSDRMAASAENVDLCGDLSPDVDRDEDGLEAVVEVRGGCSLGNLFGDGNCAQFTDMYRVNGVELKEGQSTGSQCSADGGHGMHIRDKYLSVYGVCDVDEFDIEGDRDVEKGEEEANVEEGDKDVYEGEEEERTCGGYCVTEEGEGALRIGISEDDGTRCCTEEAGEGEYDFGWEAVHDIEQEVGEYDNPLSRSVGLRGTILNFTANNQHDECFSFYFNNDSTILRNLNGTLEERRPECGGGKSGKVRNESCTSDVGEGVKGIIDGIVVEPGERLGTIKGNRRAVESVVKRAFTRRPAVAQFDIPGS